MTLFRQLELRLAEQSPKCLCYRLWLRLTCKIAKWDRGFLKFNNREHVVRQVYLLIQFSVTAYMTSYKDSYLMTMVTKIISTIMNDTIDALANLATFLSIHKGVVIKIVAIAMTKYRWANMESCGRENSLIITFVAVSPTIMLQLIIAEIKINLKHFNLYNIL